MLLQTDQAEVSCRTIELDQKINIARFGCLVPSCRSEQGQRFHAEVALYLRAMVGENFQDIITAHGSPVSICRPWPALRDPRPASPGRRRRSRRVAASPG